MSSPAISPLPPQLVTQEDRNKVATWTFFDQVFNKGNTAIVAVLGSSYKFNGSPQNNAGFIQWVEALRTTYPDMQVTFLSMIAEDNAVAIRWQMTGTHAGGTAPDGWTIEAVGNNLLTYDDQGTCLTNDQAGFCTRTQNGTATTHGNNNIYDLLLAQ
jgi:predicted ester cyclase